MLSSVTLSRDSLPSMTRKHVIAKISSLSINASVSIHDSQTYSTRGVGGVVEACFNRLTRVSNVEPFAYEDE